MKPETLRSAVRPLLPDGVTVLGAFQVMLGEPGEFAGSVVKSVVAWSADEVFVLSASRWKGEPIALLGRMPLKRPLCRVDQVPSGVASIAEGSRPRPGPAHSVRPSA